ncbi:hypothetical protein [Planobispora takensis]|uniref:Uncharacterized protein n=1 Tax=Planobispora takensis TaxID=1367882 RepID=A0A8J3TE81_9ACTN|nr:hypothetical protein [Planobispora takensis]GII05734.1 hypothetical protein Pta02_77420 [Planobispora takensis]
MHSSDCGHDGAVPIVDEDIGASAVVCLCGARWTHRAHVPPDVALRLDARLGADAWEPREPNTTLPAVWPEQRSA